MLDPIRKYIEDCRELALPVPYDFIRQMEQAVPVPYNCTMRNYVLKIGLTAFGRGWMEWVW